MRLNLHGSKEYQLHLDLYGYGVPDEFIIIDDNVIKEKQLTLEDYKNE